MKKSFIFLFLLFAISSNVKAQWVLTNAPKNVPIYSFAYNGSNVFAGGDLTGLVPTGGTVFLSTNNGLDWTTIGITPACPEIRTIALYDSNIFAGSMGGGVFLSTNMGGNWVNVSNGLTDTDVSTLLFTPNGTGGKNLFAGTGGGIYLSTNNGSNWTNVNTGLMSLGINSLDYIQNEANDIILFASTGDGVFFSTNNGSSWTQTALNSPYVLPLAISGENIFASTGFHLFLSTDRGANWIDITTGLSNLPVFALATYGTNVFALTNWGNIFLSANNGADWALINEGIIDTLVLAIGINDNYIFASGAGEGVWRRPLSELIVIVPVELISFTASANGKEVILNWSTVTELNNYGFEIQRKAIGSEFATVAFVKGQGTTTQKNEYSFADKNFDEGKYFYRLKQMDYDGQYNYSATVEVDVRMLNKFSLEQNYPNPFNPTTTIGYVLQEKSNAKLTLLNAIGEEIAVLVNEEQDKGYHKVEFDGSKLSSGVYFYQLVAGNFNTTRKLLLLK